MDIVSKEKVNFNSLEENTYKKVMKLGREIIQDELRMIDKLIKEYRDKAVFKVKDIQITTIYISFRWVTRNKWVWRILTKCGRNDSERNNEEII